MNKCTHSSIQFASGAYYIFCDNCQRRWIAFQDESLLSRDGLDFDAGSDAVSGKKRIAPPLSPAEEAALASQNNMNASVR